MGSRRFNATAPGEGAGSPCGVSCVAIPLLPVAVTPSPTDQQPLVLYSRKGCCLCEGLEERLRSLDLDSLSPPLQLGVIDIDAEGVDPALKARYDLEVPVLALGGTPLPRVSPRLQGDGLYAWLQRACASALGSD